MHKILAIDDDLYMLELYKALFVDAGFEIRVAEDALSAIMAFSDFNPDLVILDMDIPAGGGKKVYERLRNNLCSSVPIIFSTGSPELVGVIAEKYNTLVLKKPVNNDTILMEARTMLKI